MDALTDFLSSNTTLALVVSILIFITAFILVIKRLFGFFITLILLFFLVISGYAIYNHQTVQDFLNKESKPVTTTSPTPIPQVTPTPPKSDWQNQVQGAYKKIKEEFEEVKEKVKENFDKEKSTTPATK